MFYALGYLRYTVIITALVLLVGSVYFVDISILSFLFFMLSAILGVLIIYLLYTSIGLVTFWTEAIFGLRDLVSHTSMIFSGALMPLELLPRFIYRLSFFLPFRSTIHTPINIFTQGFSLRVMLWAILQQLLWVSILYVITNILWFFGVRKYTAQGG